MHSADARACSGRSGSGHITLFELWKAFRPPTHTHTQRTIRANSISEKPQRARWDRFEIANCSTARLFQGLCEPSVACCASRCLAPLTAINIDAIKLNFSFRILAPTRWVRACSLRHLSLFLYPSPLQPRCLCANVSFTTHIYILWCVPTFQS